MSGPRPLGPIVHSFFADHLVAVKGLRPATVRSYRDTVRLLLCFVADDKGTKVTRLGLADLSLERVLAFLRHLEDDRGNHVRTRNQRLAALHTLFDYIASREPEMLGVGQQVRAIPMKRAAPAGTHFLERDELEAMFRSLPGTGRLALRDRALLLFLYNTGARAQEVADLRGGNLELGEAPLVRLHGKGDKWRTCPLWRQPRRCSRSCSAPPNRTTTRRYSDRQTERPSPASASTRSCGVTPAISTTRGRAAG
jgi:integrase/recombinase XerD